MRYLPLKRALSLAAGALLCAWVLVMLLRLQSESQQAMHVQAREQAQALVSYAARNMSRWLQEKNKSELALLADNLAKDPLITDVTLYDQRGVPIAQSGNALPLESLLPIGSENATKPKQGEGRQPFIEEINLEGKTLGYLRITLEEQQLLEPLQTKLRSDLERLRLMLLVMLLAGLFISFGVRRNYVRVRKHRKKESAPTPKEEA
ncbi:AhpA/YtjB family protein [Aeromonas simiae]|uniref:AhpA/YtjB family protein n=1 Tax=Aeromonas simiae TaxID=218936 RepID=UPI00266C9F58|nr:AhpA/YtjB family protein [Aeromonas simiae]MDO2948911.1 YtjB family periplasmic protein [Aeromonas simiae]MDO2952399.1 YtjB family periplasmic protein [Aeromonas simiae]MDO2957500.1 YtjB family periplasmic protein [Aeromonas simiae]